MIEVEHLRKKYGKKQVLSDISFQIQSGESVAIAGKNGCGKSTLLQIMAGIQKADAGVIKYFGQTAARNKNIFKNYCGYAPQDNPLMEELTVKDNLRFWGSAKSEIYEELLEKFELKEMLRTPVSQLSGGMKRRLSIACALLEWPPILLMDEPTTALDIYYKEGIQEWLKEYQRLNGIILMTTHDEKEIVSADRCLVMNEGYMIELSGVELTIEKIRKYITGRN